MERRKFLKYSVAGLFGAIIPSFLKIQNEKEGVQISEVNLPEISPWDDAKTIGKNIAEFIEQCHENHIFVHKIVLECDHMTKATIGKIIANGKIIV